LKSEALTDTKPSTVRHSFKIHLRVTAKQKLATAL
jgi:hypothetical protein